ncbi:flagellar hook-associated protein 3 FlgL [Clostridium aceticum]|uniref:Flagellar hook-associated protein 3 FlgL n=1 Tax=Clostridium aceticum TaxID=84022 RepID=A0A0G3W506_9CLOT|nr:flagellar hook-associated protein FlgL [Clostridium aceticum]AKL93771.1 flagellar hook-associated protein 3 FlgL [Clostridium aceticum]
MRTTNNMMIRNMMRNLNQNVTRLDKKQMQMATGKRIHKPSDDPIAISRSLKLRADIKEMQQYKKNTDDAISWLEATEIAAINAGDALQRLRELMVQGSNGVLSTEDTRKIQGEIKEIKQQIISLGNTTYAGKYVFSGKNTNTPLFDHYGNYNVNLFDAKNPNLVDHRIQYEVGVGELIDVNTLGIDLFEKYTSASDLTLQLPTQVYDEDKKNATRLQLEGGEIVIKMTADGEPPEFEATINIHTDAGTVPVEVNSSGESKEDFMKKIIEELSDAIEDIEDPLHPLKNFNFQVQDLKQGREIADGEMTKETLIIKAIPQKSGLIHLIDTIEAQLLAGKHEEVSSQLDNLDKYIDSLLTTRAEIGAKVNRMDLVQNRTEDNIINFRKLQSQLEDADMGEVIMELMNEENVYRASLSVGARIIQPTLLDFLR